MSAMQIATVPQFRCVHFSLKQQRAVKEIESSPPFVESHEWDNHAWVRLGAIPRH
jgi:hypothetical protein